MAKNKNPLKGIDPEKVDLTQFGGIKTTLFGADPKDPENAIYNFGVGGRPGLENSPIIPDSAPALYSVAPHIQGRWDGKSVICCHDAARKVLGNDLPAQLQPRGTCGSRTGKRAGQLIQCILIAGGRPAKFKDVSHAFIYGACRADYGMTGSGQNDDGVPDGGIPPTLAKYGLVTVDEAGDTNFYGQGSDDLAVKWGASRSNIPTKMFELASDNKVEANLVKIRSFQEMMDGFASGGVGLVSSARGFTMTRDKYGMCKPSGTWYHYMAVSGGGLNKNGQKFGAIDQSWGENTPAGPTLEDGRWPNYSFGADDVTLERDMILKGSFHMIFGFPLWDEDQVVDWSKI